MANVTPGEGAKEGRKRGRKKDGATTKPKKTLTGACLRRARKKPVEGEMPCTDGER